MNTIKEMREELNNWKMLSASKVDMFNELEDRIVKVRKEEKKEKNKEKKDALNKTLAEFENIKQQLTENVYAAPGQILKLEADIRKAVRIEMSAVYRKQA